jgi:hypothetical protein
MSHLDRPLRLAKIEGCLADRARSRRSFHRLAFRQRVYGERLAQTFSFSFLFELRSRFFRRRHAAVDDHTLGKPDSRLGVPVLSHYVFDMGEAVAGGVLDAPSLPIVRPLDLGPHLSVDHEVEVSALRRQTSITP